jgi:general secretion pathway protein G
MKRKILCARRSGNSGFTLIELLLVLVIISVLAGIAVLSLRGRSTQSKITATKAEIGVIDGAMDLFEIDNGYFPSNEDGIRALVTPPQGAGDWKGPYLKKPAVPRDAWESAYVYENPGEHNVGRFDLYSWGPDRREGNDDITNWEGK